MKLLLRKQRPSDAAPQPRQLLLVGKTHALAISARPAASASSSSASEADSAPQIQLDLIPKHSVKHSLYTPLLPHALHGIIGFLETADDVFLCCIRGQRLVAHPRPGESICGIYAVEFVSLLSDQWDFTSLDVNGYPVADFGSAPTAPRAQHPCFRVQSLLADGTFYFSQDFDLTTRLQDRDGIAGSGETGGSRRNFDSTTESESATKIKNSASSAPSASLTSTNSQNSPNSDFMWNGFLALALLSFRSALSASARAAFDHNRFLATVIRGYAETARVGPSTLTILSRQCHRRAGTRFNARGIDDAGHVANHVETEIIWRTPMHCYSFVQLRGSLPLFWEQEAQLVGSKITVTRSVEAAEPAFRRHFAALYAAYGGVHIVSLLARRGQEAELGNVYRELVQRAKREFPDLEMTEFDFHAETAQGGYSEARRVLKEVGGYVAQFGFYRAAERAEKPEREAAAASAFALGTEQSGILRTNCLDCLDRTNVIQQTVSWHVMGLMVDCATELGDSAAGALRRCRSEHSSLWANNGDQLSQIYTGTNALKSSFSRSGKMNISGALADMGKSVSRRYINAFVDGDRQATIEQLLGRRRGQRSVRLWHPTAEAVAAEVQARKAEYSTQETARLFVGTFNVNGMRVGDDLATWLFPEAKSGKRGAGGAGGASDGTAETADLYVIGLQEVVELSAGSLMAAGDGSGAAFWEQRVTATLQRRGNFLRLRTEQLGSLAVMLFVRAERVDLISDVEAAGKKTGLGGIAGNKGAVAVSFRCGEAPICVVNAHLAAGVSAVEERLRDVEAVRSSLLFSRGRGLESHSAVVLAGDLNFRVGMNNEEVRAAVKMGNYTELLQRDQLLQEMTGRGIGTGLLRSFREMPIAFPPTYKFDNGTMVYDTSEKARVPSWTDRVIYRNKSERVLTPLRYGSAQEVLFSDHRPVFGLFAVDVVREDPAAKSRVLREAQQAAVAAAGDERRPEDDMDEMIPEIRTEGRPKVKIQRGTPLIDLTDDSQTPPPAPPSRGPSRSSARIPVNLIDLDAEPEEAKPQLPARPTVTENAPSLPRRPTSMMMDAPPLVPQPRKSRSTTPSSGVSDGMPTTLPSSSTASPNRATPPPPPKPRSAPVGSSSGSRVPVELPAIDPVAVTSEVRSSSEKSHSVSPERQPHKSPPRVPRKPVALAAGHLDFEAAPLTPQKVVPRESKQSTPTVNIEGLSLKDRMAAFENAK